MENQYFTDSFVMPGVFNFYQFTATVSIVHFMQFVRVFEKKRGSLKIITRLINKDKKNFNLLLVQ